MVVLRREIGDVLRGARQRQGRTLREVSSELLGSICDALDVPLSIVLREVSERVATAEGLNVPDTVPADLVTYGRGAPPWSRRAELTPVG